MQNNLPYISYVHTYLLELGSTTMKYESTSLYHESMTVLDTRLEFVGSKDNK